MKKTLMVLAAGTWLAYAAVAGAQAAGSQAAAAPGAAANSPPHAISTQDLDLMRRDIRSQKKQLIAQNLTLTDADATKFWPIYDKYAAELTKINDKKYSALQEYADHWGTITDEQATTLTKQLQDTDVEIAQLRLKYLPIVTQAIGGRKAATFAQLDRRISMMIDLQLASRIPLVQMQGH